jgi:hypothetical protein
MSGKHLLTRHKEGTESVKGRRRYKNLEELDNPKKNLKKKKKTTNCRKKKHTHENTKGTLIPLHLSRLLVESRGTAGEETEGDEETN